MSSVIVERISAILDDYSAEVGSYPIGILLGPKEYYSLCNYAMTYQISEICFFGSLVTSFMNIPVYLKELPGIDIMVPNADVMRYV